MFGIDASGRKRLRDYMAEIQCETSIDSTPLRVFELLTVGEQMALWLAPRVEANADLTGRFQLSDFNGLWVEGRYLKAIRNHIVVITWGGIDGLKPSDSTAEFALLPKDNGTLLRLRHFDLTPPSLRLHRFVWNLGLPKLKAISEGKDPNGTCLSDIADFREQYCYSQVWDTLEELSFKASVVGER